MGMACLQFGVRGRGEGIGRADPGPAEESDELYLLSAAGANIKIRDGLMDVKLLREVDGDGLERWEPVMKAAFPLPVAEVAGMFQALEVDTPVLTRDASSLDQLLAELVGPSGAVRVVRVHKRTVERRGRSRSNLRTPPPS